MVARLQSLPTQEHSPPLAQRWVIIGVVVIYLFCNGNCKENKSPSVLKLHVLCWCLASSDWLLDVYVIVCVLWHDEILKAELLSPACFPSDICGENPQGSLWGWAGPPVWEGRSYLGPASDDGPTQWPEQRLCLCHLLHKRGCPGGSQAGKLCLWHSHGYRCKLMACNE